MMCTEIARNNGEFEFKVHLTEALKAAGYEETGFDDTRGQNMPEIRDWKWLAAPGRTT